MSADPYEPRGEMPGVEDVVYDLDAAIAERDERPDFTFRFGDVVFRLPNEPDVRAIACLTKGQLYEALELLLDPLQWAKLRELPKTFDATALGELIRNYTEHAGIELGELPAS